VKIPSKSSKFEFNIGLRSRNNSTNRIGVINPSPLMTFSNFDLIHKQKEKDYFKDLCQNTQINNRAFEEKMKKVIALNKKPNNSTNISNQLINKGTITNLKQSLSRNSPAKHKPSLLSTMRKDILLGDFAGNNKERNRNNREYSLNNKLSNISSKI
jgi:hypothetical protein